MHRYSGGYLTRRTSCAPHGRVDLPRRDYAALPPSPVLVAVVSCESQLRESAAQRVTSQDNQHLRTNVDQGCPFNVPARPRSRRSVYSQYCL